MCCVIITRGVASGVAGELLVRCHALASFAVLRNGATEITSSVRALTLQLLLTGFIATGCDATGLSCVCARCGVSSRANETRVANRYCLVLNEDLQQFDCRRRLTLYYGRMWAVGMAKCGKV